MDFKTFSSFFNFHKYNSISDYYRDVPLNLIKIKKKKNIIINRLDIISFSIYSLFLIIIIRLLFLTINLDFSKNISNINNNKNTFSRPDIKDRNGEPLAVNLPTFDLYVEPHNVIYPEKSALELIKILPHLDYNDLIKKLKSNRKFIYIERKISPSDKNKIMMIGEPGFKFLSSDYRFYPQNTLFSHIIGNIDIDNKGISGIEKFIDSNLLNNSKSPILLSVDLYVQDALRQNLSIAMQKYHALAASGIVMDVKTGEILGMVSLPDFHNNNIYNILNNPLYNNHNTLDVYEIGSVMKIFNTALALENNYPQDKIFDVSKPFVIGNFKVRDSHPKKWLINMNEAFIYSSNIASAIIATDLGIDKQKEFFNRLHFFSKMNFELPELGTPLLPKKWDNNVNASMSYGYSISLTLLHTIAAVNAIINDGMYVNPTLIKKDENSILKSFQVVKPSTSAHIKKLMHRVITDGTGYNANLDNVKVGGKTGTAYKFLNGAYSNKKIRTFFVSIFPVDDPKYIMLIMLDEANNNGCISSACTTVPISAKIIQDISPLLNINLN